MKQGCTLVIDFARSLHKVKHFQLKHFVVEVPWCLNTHDGWLLRLPPAVCSDAFFLHVCHPLCESHVDRGLFKGPFQSTLRESALRHLVPRWPHLLLSLVVPLSQEQEGLRSVHRILELVWIQRRAVAGDDGGGEAASISAVEAAALPSLPSAHFAEQTLDFLHQLEDHCLSEQDVDPRVQDGVDGGHADGLQVSAQLQPLVCLASLQLIHKNPELMTVNKKLNF